MKISYPCPCCGFLVFEEPPGSYEICPICSWEDDVSQLRFPLEGGGANTASLVLAQQNFSRKILKGTESELKPFRRDLKWRPLDLSLDIVEVLDGQSDMGSSYPEDRTSLYYWHKN